MQRPYLATRLGRRWHNALDVDRSTGCILQELVNEHLSVGHKSCFCYSCHVRPFQNDLIKIMSKRQPLASEHWNCLKDCALRVVQHDLLLSPLCEKITLE